MRRTLALSLAAATLVAGSIGGTAAAIGLDQPGAGSTVQASGSNPPTHCC